MNQYSGRPDSVTIIGMKTTGLGRLLSFALILLSAWMVVVAAQRPPSFDGGMNLQVAWSLAEGEGYRRTYADRPPFPAEVQTNAPFVVPAAIVFRLLGVGMVQAQLVNLLYLGALTLAVFLMMRRRFGLAAASSGALLLLVTPGVMSFGLAGYGEVPALFWAILALIVFPWDGRLSKKRVASAAICLGLALITKSMMALAVAVFGLAMCTAIVANGKLGADQRVKGLLAMAAFCLPLAAVETGRIYSLGGWGSYAAWWINEVGEIGAQAGVSTGFEDTSGYTSKISAHLKLLSGMYGLPLPVLVLWLLAPPVLATLLVARTRSPRQEALLLCLLVAAGAYFFWWLAVTPTQKAWHRRILVGSLMLNIAWAYLGARFALSTAAAERRLRWIGYATLLSCALLFMLFFSKEMARTHLLPRGDDPLVRAARLVKRLPREADIYAIGWNSAPVVSLFAERPCLDFNDVVVGGRPLKRPAYLVVDTATAAAGVHRPILEMYTSQPLLPSGSPIQVHRIWTEKLDGVNRGLDTSLPSIVDLREGYPHTGGFYAGPWMRSDAYVRLQYPGNDSLVIALYAPPFEHYVGGTAPALSASIDGCTLGSRQLQRPGVSILNLRIPAHCQPKAGTVVTVRLSSDSLIDNSINRDDRALALIVNKVGFVSACADPASCEAALDLSLQSDASSSTKTDVDLGSTSRSESMASDLVSVEPTPIDRCPPDGPAITQARVHWNASHRKINGVQIWVSAPGEPRKLWIATGSLQGTQSTGHWVRDRTRFDLTDAQGNQLAIKTVELLECRN